MKTKELIICVITLIILGLVITTNVYATSSVNDLNELLGNTNTNDEYENIQDTTNTNTNYNTNYNTNNETNNTVETMPTTGIDYSIVFIIGICGISAVYAFKKIRDYNIK